MIFVDHSNIFFYDGRFHSAFAPRRSPRREKRMDNSASLRGQVIMWHRFLSKIEEEANDLFPPEARRRPACLKFGEPPKITLPTRVPEDVWGIQKRKEEAERDQEEMVL